MSPGRKEPPKSPLALVIDYATALHSDAAWYGFTGDGVPDEPVTKVIEDRELGVVVTVTLRRFEAARLVLNEAGRAALIGDAPLFGPGTPVYPPPAASSAAAPPVQAPVPTVPLPMPLREVEDAAWQAAPAAGARPISMKELARRAGYGYNSHFLEAVRGMIDRGILTRLRGGVRRAQ